MTNWTMSPFIDSDTESRMTLGDETGETSTAGPIKRTVEKMKSKLKGSPSDNPPARKEKHTIYTPSALSTWQAIAGMLLPSSP